MNLGWQIIDEEGVVHSGTEEEMNEAFEIMTSSSDDWEQNNPDSNWKDIADKWICDWVGDLVMVQVTQIYR